MCDGCGRSLSADDEQLESLSEAISLVSHRRYSPEELIFVTLDKSRSEEVDNPACEICATLVDFLVQSDSVHRMKETSSQTRVSLGCRLMGSEEETCHQALR